MYRLAEYQEGLRSRESAIWCEYFSQEVEQYCLEFLPNLVFVRHEALASHAAVRRLSFEANNPTKLKIYVNVNSHSLRQFLNKRFYVRENKLYSEDGQTSADIFDPFRDAHGERFAFCFVDSSWRCDRPTRSYPAATTAMMQSAFSTHPGEFCLASPMIRFDNYRRLWTKGYPFPSQILRWAHENQAEFRTSLSALLRTLIDLAQSSLGPVIEHDKLTQHLTRYYRRIRLVSSTPTQVFKLNSLADRAAIASIAHNRVKLQFRSTGAASVIIQAMEAVAKDILEINGGGAEFETGARITAASEFKKLTLSMCRQHNAFLKDLEPKLIARSND
ncbi:hypothetical protein [Litoreibacter janthinus]|uniref:Uncharacterized protein n=1 Tax=Litoreibacter janthinus TaxID=670154 RepID=A0A1I6HRZ4_9RHOB|nr:hypothetical protein [Litoreibacter janthinus]SFR57193.1 hypothetical protein SAMN04488002_3326 [Litoreibacter janthinus]